MPYLFVSEWGGPLTARAVRYMVLRAGKVAGLPFPIHPYMLWHACGFYLANKGIDTRATQQYMGHCSIQYTVRYTLSIPHRFPQFWDG
jgi:type 1 fimbriae regulatory protein FimB/type 1 fimbriae regulatory protein FimE